jgi:hypothetical protein
MKKINLLMIYASTFSLMVAQNVALEKVNITQEELRTTKTLNYTPSTNDRNPLQTAATPLWSDDFSDPTTWTLGHAPGSNLDWVIGRGFDTENPHPTINSSSKLNGFAFLDSYRYTIDNESEVQSSWITTASPINLSSNENLVLQFETFHFNFQSKCYVVISSTNEDWPDLNPNFDAETDERVYELFEGVETYEGVRKNPTLTRLNISKIAGGEENIWVRFHWTGKAYSWLLDDVAINEQPNNDIVLNTGFISSDGLEYGRIPVTQQKVEYLLIGEVFNFGSEDQTDVQMNMKVLDSNNNEMFGTIVSSDLIKKDSTYLLQNIVRDFNPLEPDNYKLDFTVSSGMDKEGGANFTNNQYKRNFQITKDLYSLDGIGIYENAFYKSDYGTSRFQNNSDGLVLMTLYNITEPTKISGLEVGIAEGSKENAEISPFILTLDAVYNKTFYDRIVESETPVKLSQEIVNETDITKRFVFAPLPSTILQPGTYFACVELFSNNNQNDVFVLDDITIAQDFNASMIYLPNNADQLTSAGAYSNGNAFAIRLGLEEYFVGTEEKTPLDFSIFPNPSNGLFTINYPGNETYKVEIINILGEVLSVRNVKETLNETIDMTNYNPGLYFVKTSNGKAESTKKVIIK